MQPYNSCFLFLNAGEYFTRAIFTIQALLKRLFLLDILVTLQASHYWPYDLNWYRLCYGTLPCGGWTYLCLGNTNTNTFSEHIIFMTQIKMGSNMRYYC